MIAGRQRQETPLVMWCQTQLDSRTEWKLLEITSTPRTWASESTPQLEQRLAVDSQVVSVMKTLMQKIMQAGELITWNMTIATTKVSLPWLDTQTCQRHLQQQEEVSSTPSATGEMVKLLLGGRLSPTHGEPLKTLKSTTVRRTNGNNSRATSSSTSKVPLPPAKAIGMTQICFKSAMVSLPPSKSKHTSLSGPSQKLHSSLAVTLLQLRRIILKVLKYSKKKTWSPSTRTNLVIKPIFAKIAA